MKLEQFVAAVLAFASVCSHTDGSQENRYRADRKRATDSQVEAAPAARRRYVPSDAERRKRGFSPWTGSHDQFQGHELSIWKPPVYQLSRPYYIPLYGAPGRTPLYFPPQPLNINPGIPPDNPMRPPFRGPPYLPPNPPKPTTEKPKNGTMKVNNRNDFDEDEDRPVWGGDDVTRAPQVVPTRPTRPPGLPDFPPLVHDIGGNGLNMLAADDEYDDMPAFIRPPSTSRPFQQPTTRRVSTTQRPPAAVQVPSGPSNCVWAVVSCCSGASSVVAESCFEQKGCPGPFWDRSPCDSDFARAAIATALNYYNQ